MSVLITKPFFELKLEAFGVAHFVELNGISLVKEYDSFGKINTVFPVNHWFRPNQNVFGIYVLPDIEGEPINSNSYVNLALHVKDLQNESESYEVASICFSGKHLEVGDAVKGSTYSGKYDSAKGFSESKSGDVLVEDINMKKISEYEGCLFFERKLNIPSSLPKWAFFSSDELPDYDNISDSDYSSAKIDLYQEYEKIQRFVLNADLDSIVSLLAERNTETDKAFYLKPGETERKMRASLEGSLKDSDLELAELNPDYVDIRIEDNRKLVRLLRGDESSAIGFNFKSIQGSLSYDFFFRRDKGKWIITR